MLRLSPSTLAASALSLLVVWAPIPFGSVTPTGRAVLAIGGTATLLLGLRSRHWPVALAQARWGLVGLAGLGIWGCLQALPLPIAWVDALSPETTNLLRENARALGSTVPATSALSLAPSRSLDVGLWCLVLAGTGLAAAVASALRGPRRVVLGALLLAALFEALYGAGRWSVSAGMIWGVSVPGGGGRLRGTFVNPDHLALYLELALAVVTAWLFWSLYRGRRRGSLDQRILSVAAPSLAWLTIFSCLAFTGSRAGLVVALLTTGVQGLLVALARRQRRWLPAGFALGALGLAIVASIGLQAGLGRWLGTSAYELTWNSRRAVYSATWELTASFPGAGIGLGAFRDVFPLVQPATAPGLWTHAHNDWLELLVSAGWPVTLLFLGMLLGFVRGLLSSLGRHRRTETKAVVLAALGALVAAGLHSFLDFGLAMPANAFTLVVLCGLGAGAADP